MTSHKKYAELMLKQQATDFLADYKLIRDMARNGPECVTKKSVGNSDNPHNQKLAAIFERSEQENMDLHPVREGLELIDKWLNDSSIDASDRARFTEVYTACNRELMKLDSVLGRHARHYNPSPEQQTGDLPPEIQALQALSRILDLKTYLNVKSTEMFAFFMNEINEPLRKIRSGDAYTPPLSELIPGNFG
ncbi:MAG: hypothetical protein H6855_07695 [Rhodospirillales bacterium]|nr:hypothetical protein [Rhodospirillales bacterium]MCB9979711.1 hypothetical protein [Rhodospirillales bacterium]